MLGLNTRAIPAVWVEDGGGMGLPPVSLLLAALALQAQAKLDRFSGCNLYIKNLDDMITDDDLRTLFQEHGIITSCKVMKDEAGGSRGSGFVAFSTPEEATRAITEMNGKMVRPLLDPNPWTHGKGGPLAHLLSSLPSPQLPPYLSSVIHHLILCFHEGSLSVLC